MSRHSEVTRTLLALSIRTSYSEEGSYPQRSRSIHWAVGPFEGTVDLFRPRSLRGIRYMFGVQRFPFDPNDSERMYEHYFARGALYRAQRLRWEAEQKARAKARNRAAKAA